MRKDKSDYTTQDMYDFYKLNVLEGLHQDYNIYSKVINMFNKSLVDKILKESIVVTLPCRLGQIGVRKSKMSFHSHKLKVDWATTMKLWEENPEAKESKKLVYHLNEHRKNYKYKIFWDRKGMNVRGHKPYRFTPTRTFKRKLAFILKNKPEIDYFL